MIVSKSLLQQSIREWLDKNIVPLFKEKPSDKALKLLELYVEVIVQEERDRASEMVMEYAGSDERWIAEEIRRGDYGKKRTT